MDAIDYFAGAGGWDVACRWLGIDVTGVENMPAALATREANGLDTLLHDVWDAVLAEQPYTHELQIASPPCQPFSMAGLGAGRRELDHVYRLIRDGAYRDGHTYYVTSAHLDPKTSLVLTPLVLAWRDRPAYIAWEQVPAVLPVWEACADVLRSIGYSVWTGNVQAEQYGVPQTRRRAVLIARRDGLEAHRPTPTHSKFHSRDPKRTDPGVLPWVSMAQALGWGMTERPGVTAGNAVGRGLIGGSGAKSTVLAAMDAGRWIDSPHGDASTYGERTRTTVSDAGALQTFPTETAHAHELAFPIALTAEPGASLLGPDGAKPRRMIDEPAYTITGGAPAGEGGGQRHRWALSEAGLYRDGISETRTLDLRERATLQTFPQGFVFGGTKGQQFLQVGNAVPPLMAHAILRTFL